ncbi:MAG TPA: hypothetical protein VK784_06660, partial [Pseudonocardiaceae bacterium]|nr:hypothetical protein [Pseudonocardiaceae bacterium]
AGTGTRTIPQRQVHTHEPSDTSTDTSARGERAPSEADDRGGDGYQGHGGPESGRSPRRWWAAWLRGRPGWVMGSVAAVALFAGVVGSITVFELAAGKPLEAVVWHRSGSGTTVGGVVGGQPSHSSTPAARTGKQAGKASSSPSPGSTGTNSPSPSPTVSSGSPSPTSTGSPSPTPSSPSPSSTTAPAASSP